jgi:hypothetical protein
MNSVLAALAAALTMQFSQVPFPTADVKVATPHFSLQGFQAGETTIYPNPVFVPSASAGDLASALVSFLPSFTGSCKAGEWKQDPQDGLLMRGLPGGSKVAAGVRQFVTLTLPYNKTNTPAAVGIAILCIDTEHQVWVSQFYVINTESH